jgi:hypothetical protein
MMHALPALLMVLITSEAGHMATLAMVVVAVVLAALVGILTLRRRSAMRGLAPNTGSCSSVTGCCRR